MTQAAKTDGNHTEIVRALCQAGAAVQSLAGVGKGCPDLLVAFDGAWYVMEVKNGANVPSKRRLTPDEAKWHQTFSQYAAVPVVESVEDALRVIGRL